MAKISKKAKNSVKTDIYHFPLRLKKDVANKVIKRSKQQRRSLNAQIEHELNENE